MTMRNLIAGAAGLVLVSSTGAYAQSAGCSALMQAGADAISSRIAMEDGTLQPPTSVRNLTCLGDFFGVGLNLIPNLTDFTTLAANLVGQFCTAVKSAWQSQVGSVNCGLTVTGINFGMGSLGGGNFCGQLTIGGGAGSLGQYGFSGNANINGSGTYIVPLSQQPTGYER